MTQDFVLNEDQLVPILNAVSARVSRSDLQQILVDSKLLPKNTPREELRRLCPANTAWVRFVAERLRREPTRPAAMRALCDLVSLFVSKPNLDHRVESSLRKGRQAAERGDLERVRRELDRLAEYAVELDAVELRRPAVLLYLWCGSQRARDCVSQGFTTESTHAPETPAGLATDSRVSPTPPTAAIARELPRIIPFRPEQTRGAEQFFPETAALISDLQKYLDSGGSDRLRWNFEELLNSRLPEPDVVWPAPKEFFSSLGPMQSKFRSISANIDAARGGLENLPSLKRHMEHMRELLGSLDSLVQKITQLDQAVREIIEAKLSIAAPELQEESASIRSLLSGAEPETYPLREVESFLKRNRALYENKVTSMLTISDRIAALTPFLSDEAQKILEAKVRHLLLNFKHGELERLLAETEGRTEEPRRLKLKIKDGATRVIEYLRATPGIRVDRNIAETVQNAVAAGNPEAALEILVPPLRTAVGASEPGIIQHVVTAPPPTISRPSEPAPSTTPAALGEELNADLGNFVPRDRITSASPVLPNDVLPMLRLLRARALEEVDRGSTGGALDHALDILQLAARAKNRTDYWPLVGLTLILSLPSIPGAVHDWGPALGPTLRQSLTSLDKTTLINYASNFITQPDFDEAAAERFVHEEIGPFADLLVDAVYTAIVSYRQYLLEDVARAVAMGSAYADINTSKKILLALARRAGEKDQVVNYFQQSLQEGNRAIGPRMPELPQWIQEGIKSYNALNIERAKPIARSVGRLGALRITVPRSVSVSGGFALSPGSEEVNFALLLSNQQSRPVSCIEITIPAVRNRWLTSDVICSTGPLAGNALHIVQIRGHLAADIAQTSRLEAGLVLRYKEPGSRETKFQDTSVNLTFQHNITLEIPSYEGAGGKPLILEGEALKYSSSSVRKALTEVLAGLTNKGIAACVIGRRRRGKTSILQTIARDSTIRERYSIVSDSWEDLPSRSLTETLRHLGNIFDRAARALNVAIDPLEHRLQLEVGPGWPVIQQWLDELTSKLNTNTKLLLLIDEFQKWLSLLESEDRTRVLYILRGLFNRPEGGRLSISIILSGLSNIRDFTRSSADFENAFRMFNIEAFTLAEANALVRSNPAIEFDSRAVVRIRDLSGGNPFLINLLCEDIVSRLREHGRAYCLPEDVEKVVRSQLEDKQSSRVWNFLQYLLKEGEEDHAAEICELPTLLALAYAFRKRGTGRKLISSDEIAAELHEIDISCDPDTLREHLSSAVRNELLVQDGSRYAFANGWLAEWLSVDPNLLPILPQPDKELVLRRFRLGKFVERGGQASVYEAQDVHSFNRTVIVKIYPRVQQAGVGSSVMREAKLLNSIEHNAIVRCIEYGEDLDKGDVIVLERVKGDTLRQLLQDRPRHAVDLIGLEGNLKIQLKFIEQIAAALCECHRVGVVHKDLKPENIIAQQSAGIWLPKIIDFGLASNVSEMAPDTKTVGSYTPGYVAPERYRGEGRRAPADIYSLGVIAYELLTGTAPFSSDPIQAREAQETGTFVAANQQRPEIPTALSELLSEMMSPDPATRPNAFTLTSRLATVLQTADWLAEFETAKRAYGDGDTETALEYLERSAFSAPEEGRRSPQYTQLLDLFADTADAGGRLLSLAPELVQPFAMAALRDGQAAEPFARFISKLLAEPPADPAKRESQRSAVQTMMDLLADVPPSANLSKVIEHLLKSAAHPAIWDYREEVFLLGLAYRDESLIQLSLLGNWCLSSARKLREREGALLGAQMWLRRGERIGIDSSIEFRKENAELEKLLRRTANPPLLPKIPEKQEPASKVVGEDERGHLHTAKIVTWVTRLLRLHPYVQGVRRVKRDRNLPLTPTRMLSLDNISQHLTQAMGNLDPARIIPAVLDESYCIPRGTTVLRINIVLPGGTTIAQREAVIKSLREDSSLFETES